MSHTYDVSTGRYRDTTTGRLVSERAIRDQIDALADAASERLANLTDRLLRGDLTLAAWQSSRWRTSQPASWLRGAGRR
jgi:hypothetical protein